MKKSGVLNFLEQLKNESQQKPAAELETMPLRIIAVLLDYINDQEVTQAIDEINF